MDEIRDISIPDDEAAQWDVANPAYVEVPLSELGRIHDMFCTISAQLDELLQLKTEFETTMQDMAGSGLMGMIGKMFK